MSVKRFRQPPERKKVDLGLAMAVKLANYELQVKKQTRRELAVNKEIKKVTDSYRDDLENEITDWFYGAFALALHRKHKFGAKRIAALFDELQSIKHELLESGMDHEQVWDLVREEVGLDIIAE